MRLGGFVMHLMVFVLTPFIPSLKDFNLFNYTKPEGVTVSGHFPIKDKF